MASFGAFVHDCAHLISYSSEVVYDAFLGIAWLPRDRLPRVAFLSELRYRNLHPTFARPLQVFGETIPELVHPGKYREVSHHRISQTFQLSFLKAIFCKYIRPFLLIFFNQVTCSGIYLHWCRYTWRLRSGLLHTSVHDISM